MWYSAKAIFCVGMYGKISMEEPYCLKWLLNMKLGYPAAALVQSLDIWSLVVTRGTYS